MLRIIVLVSLIFSTVGVTIESCACPKVEVKLTACSQCHKEVAQKTKSCCPTCNKHLVLKTDFQKPPVEFHPTVQPAASYFSLAVDLKTLSRVPFAYQRDDSNTISPGSVEKCALLSTFLI